MRCRVPVVFVAALLVLVPAAPAQPPKGGTPLDQSIERALEFLRLMQGPDGSWRIRGAQRNVAISALAVMAFLSSGHVPGEGPYGETIENGIRYVIAMQQPNGLIATEGAHEMYHHGICTLMLAEVAGMTKGPLADEVRHKLEKAVAVILKGQRKSGVHRGGWRYRVEGYDSDISVTGWQLLALRAARNLGCDVPASSIEEAVQYIQRCRDPGTGGYRYLPGGPVTMPCTGTSILGLELCGKDQHASPEVLRAGAFLLKVPPRWGQPHFPYSIYYCSQATFQLGDTYWNHYRPQLHDALLGNQSENGSWFSQDNEGRHYGPIYCTAMSVLALTVEYRFLPIYQRGEEPPKADN